MQGRLHPLKREEETRAAAMGIGDIKRKFSMEEMASGDVIFSATGVTDGSLLDGVHFHGVFRGRKPLSCGPRRAPCGASRPASA